MPVRGVYAIKATVAWGATGTPTALTDQRMTTIYLQNSSAYMVHGWEQIQIAGTSASSRWENRTYGNIALQAGERVRVGCWQDSASAKDIGFTQLDVSLVFPY
jgi:hypothetical protein